MKDIRDNLSKQPKVVNYSELTGNKKAEFFNFLISNNIKFEEGEQNYFAKVIIKDKDKSEKNINTSTAKENVAPNKLHSKSKKPLKPVRSSKSIQKIQIKTPIKKEKLMTKTLQSSSSSCKSQLNLSDIEAKTDKSSVSKFRTNVSRKQRQLSLNKSKDFRGTSKSKSRENKENREKSHPKNNYQKQIKNDERLEAYLQLFGITVSEGRASRWPLNQLNRAIQQIYTANFTKNTTLLKSKRFRQNLQRTGVFAEFILELYTAKFKTKKHINHNIMNLVSSLLYHLNDTPINLMIFLRFIQDQYTYHDLVFFLFVRSIFERQFGSILNLDKTLSDISNGINKRDKKRKDDQEDFSLLMSKKDVVKFIKGVFGKQSELVLDYQKLIFVQMNGAEKIPVYHIFYLLIQDYHNKSQTNRNFDSATTNGTQKNQGSSIPSQINTSKSLKPPKLPLRINTNTQETANYSYNQQDLEQLTFGDQKREKIHFHEQDFWAGKEISEFNFTNDIEKYIIAKMNQKVKDLVNIMLADQNENIQYKYSHIYNLILKKSYNLIQSIFIMDKINWFTQLMIHMPTSQQLQQVEHLQLMIRKLHKNVDNKILSDFCKQILTIEQFKRAIQRLVMTLD